MLIITRRPDESFEIGNNVKVTILAIRGGQIRIGIAAPKEIAVHRTEVAARIKLENGGKLPGKEAV